MRESVLSAVWERVKPILFSCLVLLPFVALHLGFAAYHDNELRGRVRGQEERARHLLEKLGGEGNFPDQFRRQGVAFSAGLQAAIEGRSSLDAGQVMRCAEALTVPPFPPAEVWVFRFPASGSSGASTSVGKPEALFVSPGATIGRAVVARILGYLVDSKPLSGTRNLDNIFAKGRSQDDESSLAIQPMVRVNLGPLVFPKLLAKSQRGIPTPIISRKQPGWLYWDFIQAPDESKIGFILKTPANPEIDEAGFRLALRQAAALSPMMMGFVRVFPHRVGHVLDPRLERSRLFRGWARRMSRWSNLFTWEKKGTPWAEPLGKYQAFSLPALNSSHLPVLLLRPPSRPPMPVPLMAANLLFLAGLVLLLTRGLILGKWPEGNLEQRFMFLFFVAAALPLILFFLSAGFYLQERRNTDLHQQGVRLLQSLQNLEAGKERLEGEYKAAFASLLHDGEFLDLLKTGGMNAVGLGSRLRSHFQGSVGSLPLAIIGILDHSGNGMVETSAGLDADQVTSALKMFEAGFVRNLRSHIANQDPTVDLGKDPVEKDMETNFGSQAFESATGNSFLDEFEKSRSAPFYFRIGRSNAAFIHDYLAFGGCDRYAVFVAWMDAHLDRQILAKGAEEIRNESPDIEIMAFSRTNRDLAPILDTTGSVASGAFLKAAREAREFGAAITLERGTCTIRAMPSTRYANIILAAGSDLQWIDEWVSDQKFRFGLLFLVSLLAALVFSRLTAYRTVVPINELKDALDHVAAGNLEVRMTMNRSDEIGQLATTFTQMVDGLAERRRMASLISGEAMAAIEASHEVSESLRCRTIQGVILVSDLRSFTTLCERETPAAVTRLLNRHFSAMSECISARGGRIHKFVGDAIQALFEDRPGQSAPAAERAIEAALEMLHRLDEINVGRQADSETPYRIGIGLAGGTFAVGAVGTAETRLDYAILGEAFKRAEELEGSTKSIPSCPLAIGPELVPSAGRFAFRLQPLPDGAVPAVSFPTLPEAETASVSNTPVQESSASPSPALEEFIPSKNAVNPSGGAIFRPFIFVVGALWLLAPLVVLLTAISGRDALLEAQRLGEIQERQTAFLQKIRSPSAPQGFLEDFIEKNVAGLANAVEASAGKGGFGTSSGDEVQGQGAEFVARLTGVGIRPEALFIQRWDHDESDGGSVSRADENRFCLGLEPDEVGLVQSMLVTRLDSLGPSQVADLEQSLGRFLGGNLAWSTLKNEARGRLFPVTYEGKPGWLYWDYLYRPSSTLEPIDPGVSGSEFLAVRSSTHGIAGIVFLIIPRGTLSMADMTRRLDEPDLALAVISSSTDAPVRVSPRFPASLAGALSRSELSLETSDGVLAQTEIPYENARAVVWSPLPSQDSSRFGSGLWGFVAAAIGVLLLVGWGRSVFYGKALARSLLWQLLAGLLSAAILPILSAFPLVERFPIEERGSLKREERNLLREKLHDLERRAIMQRSVMSNALLNWARNPRLVPLLNAVREEQAIKGRQRSGPSKARLQRLVHGELNRFTRDGIRPRSGDSKARLTIPLSSAQGLSSAGGVFNFKEGAMAEDSSFFANIMGAIGKRMLKTLGGESAPVETLSKQQMFEEEATEVGLKIMASVFGPDLYFRLINAPETPLVMQAGIGATTLLFSLVPDVLRPSFLMAFFYSSSKADSRALSRVLRDRIDRHGFLTKSQQCYGQLGDPDQAGRFASARKMARWATLTKAPVSDRVVEHGIPLLVEARPGIHLREDLLISVSAEAPLQLKAERRRRDLLGWFIAALLTTLFLALAVARDISKPIGELDRAMAGVRSGKYATRLPAERGDEIGDLLRAFNLMVRGLQERELISRMLSQDAKRKAAELDDRQKSEGTRCERTILSIVIPGFEAIAHRYAPETLFGLLTQQTDVIVKQIRRAGGDCDKILGDKILAVFDHERGMRETAEAAMRASLDLVLESRVGRLPFPFALGIARGTVIAGVLGAGKQRDFTVIGDAVNSAARISALAATLPEPRILVTEAVRMDLGEKQSFVFHGEVSVKGKDERLALYQFAG